MPTAAPIPDHDPSTRRDDRPSPLLLGLLAVRLMLGATGVAVTVAGLLYLVAYDPATDARERSIGGFYPLALVMIAVGIGLLLGGLTLVGTVWQERQRLGPRPVWRAVVLVVCLAALGLATTGLLGQGSFSLLAGLSGDATRRLHIAAPAVAAASCLVVAPFGLGLALARRTAVAGLALTAVAAAAALSTPFLLSLDAARAREAAATELPYVLPSRGVPEAVDAAAVQPQQVALSPLALGELYELLLPLQAQAVDRNRSSDQDDAVEITTSAVMLSELPACDDWREARRCTRAGEDTVVERDGQVVVVRPGPEGGAYGVLLHGPTAAHSPRSDAEVVDRARRLVADLRVVSRADYEDALGVRVNGAGEVAAADEAATGRRHPAGATARSLLGGVDRWPRDDGHPAAGPATTSAG